jgi:hypothetical protein
MVVLISFADKNKSELYRYSLWLCPTEQLDKSEQEFFLQTGESKIKWPPPLAYRLCHFFVVGPVLKVASRVIALLHLSLARTAQDFRSSKRCPKRLLLLAMIGSRFTGVASQGRDQFGRSPEYNGLSDANISRERS